MGWDNHVCVHDIERSDYVGEQDDGAGGVLYLWTCRDCRSTWSGPSLSHAMHAARLMESERPMLEQFAKAVKEGIR